MSDKDTNNTD